MGNIKKEETESLDTPIHRPNRFADDVLLSQCGHVGEDRETKQKVYLQVPATEVPVYFMSQDMHASERVGVMAVCMASMRKVEYFEQFGRNMPWSTYCGAVIPWPGKAGKRMKCFKNLPEGFNLETLNALVKVGPNCGPAHQRGSGRFGFYVIRDSRGKVVPATDAGEKLIHAPAVYDYAMPKATKEFNNEPDTAKDAFQPDPPEFEMCEELF